MDFRLSSEAEALRQEAREFARREWDPHGYDFDSMVVTSYDFDSPEARALVNQFEKKLIARGWYTMHWPQEHGGKAISIEMQMAYREGMAYEKAPASLGGGLVAPLLMIHGSDWQKREFLPRIANADIEFGQGFSEPNAGSDLANLQTRAVVDGDDLVITGQKIWSSGAHFADWYHALVRTDPDAPKHRGITYVLVSLRDERGRQAPGIVMRPLFDMMGRHRWNEVFLDGVRVPRRNVIGEMNRGWYAAMTTLSFERSN
ncbi:MAG: acyl-CoA dehydrogenase family protein, partial [Chloroflexi bacterium]|nr:acyl-CoA dehydrogenase family protein [Chloroflexota bacterium]